MVVMTRHRKCRCPVCHVVTSDKKWGSNWCKQCDVFFHCEDDEVLL